MMTFFIINRDNDTQAEKKSDPELEEGKIKLYLSAKQHKTNVILSYFFFLEFTSHSC